MTGIALYTLIFTPLIGFLANSFIKWNRNTAAAIGCSACLISFISTVFLFASYWSQPSVQIVPLSSWISWSALKVDIAFLIDALSLVMSLVITGVGCLIHLFSCEYMRDDPRIGRYFSYLNLFIFNMLVLVLADNLLLMFVGWEGVGLCSYLLIGFWFEKKEKAEAGMKAFIVNRIGDAGFLIGIFLFFSLFGSLNFLALNSSAAGESAVVGFLTCLCLFIGAAGKSAQLPLYVWLPSAMAGPTPVSALIHAATMVTAGIYLIIRTEILWTASSAALYTVGAVGALTAVLGAFLACKAWDVKKILAYSTMSQLGYMFLSLGVGAFSTALFHLITHAFFKACLFLSAGSLIYGLNGEQDIRNMGGLRKKMPFTFFGFLTGALALAGIPPLSGFFSKDEILYHSFHNGFYFLWALGLTGAGLTAFYTVKTLYFVFWKPAVKNHSRVHEGSWVMNFPIIILAVLSAAAGVLNWPHFLPKTGLSYQWLSHWLKPVQDSHTANVMLELVLAAGSSLFTGIVLFISGVYLVRNKKIKRLAWIFNWNWSLDQFYHNYFVKGVQSLSQEMMDHIEASLLQKGIQMLVRYFVVLRNFFSSFQSGQLHHYLLFMAFGFLIFILTALFR